MIATVEKPQVLKRGVLGIGMCVPKAWTDTQVEEFAEADSPCGTTAGWQVYKTGKDPERVDCEDRAGFIHIVVMA